MEAVARRQSRATRIVLAGEVFYLAWTAFWVVCVQQSGLHKGGTAIAWVVGAFLDFAVGSWWLVAILLFLFGVPWVDRRLSMKGDDG